MKQGFENFSRLYVYRFYTHLSADQYFFELKDPLIRRLSELLIFLFTVI